MDADADDGADGAERLGELSQALERVGDHVPPSAVRRPAAPPPRRPDAPRDDGPWQGAAAAKPRQHAKELRELSTRAKWAVAALGRDPG